MKKALHLQISIAILIGALIVAVIASVYLYQYTYDQEVEDQKIATLQLLQTVENSAAIASYLNHYDMAQEVVMGLVKNDIINYASLSTKEGLSVSSNDNTSTIEKSVLTYPIASPFLADDIIAEITLLQNQALIEEHANATALIAVLILAGQTLIVAGLSMFLIFHMVTKHIVSIGEKLHEITPGKAARLPHLEAHRDNELGVLTKDINSLLDTAKDTLDRERHLREHVEALEQHYRRIFEDATAGIFLIDRDARILSCNKAFYEITNYSNVAVASMNGVAKQKLSLLDFFDDKEHLKAIISDAQDNNVSADLQLTADGQQPYWVHCVFSVSMNSDTGGIVQGFIYDITERRMHEEEMRHSAEIDHLTGLFNRRSGEERLDHLIRNCRQSGIRSLVFLIDLDGFKLVNDEYGHDAGDLALIEVARRLKQGTRLNDAVIRWGGDEFLMAYSGDATLNKGFQLAEKIINKLSKPIDIGGGHTGSIGASIGIAIIKPGNMEREMLIKLADIGMYKVKTEGKNGACFYDEEHESYRLSFFVPDREPLVKAKDET
ncbi:MAG: diguanylate cyclase [Gammaproteobacteria bacterium]|nr:diguanylate cyclase [Gammaproteobacteria bacterium]